MTNPIAETAQRKTARIAGSLYLLNAVCGGFSMMYVDPKLYVRGDAGGILSNILASEWLFRLGFVSSLISLICFLFLANVLYTLLKSVDKDQARLMVVLVAAGVAISWINMLNTLAPILLLKGAGYLSAFEPAQLRALAIVFLDISKHGDDIAWIFWGLWLFPFGLLVFKSDFIPKVLGVLLMVGGFGYIIHSFVGFFFPSFEAITYWGSLFGAIAELACILWLLIKGVKGQKPASIEAG